MGTVATALSKNASLLPYLSFKKHVKQPQIKKSEIQSLNIKALLSSKQKSIVASDHRFLTELCFSSNFSCNSCTTPGKCSAGPLLCRGTCTETEEHHISVSSWMQKEEKGKTKHCLHKHTQGISIAGLHRTKETQTQSLGLKLQEAAVIVKAYCI